MSPQQDTLYIANANKPFDALPQPVVAREPKAKEIQQVTVVHSPMAGGTVNAYFKHVA